MNSCESLPSSPTVMVGNKQRRLDNLEGYRLKILHRIQDAFSMLEEKENTDQTLCKIRGLFKHLENLEEAIKAF